MHPMAVYCALKGLAPMVPTFAVTPPGWRIRWPGAKARQIAFLPEVGGWRVSAARTSHLVYREIAWDEIPDDTMDQLTPQLVDNLTGEPS